MTRKERRRRRARARRIRLVVVAATLATMVMCASFVLGKEGAGTAAEVQANEPKAVQSTPVLLVSTESTVEEKQQKTVDAEGPEESEDPEPLEDYENEKIEEALLEDGYLSDEIPLDYDTQACLRAWCEQYSVPYKTALSVIETESSFRADAQNGSCYGYMQVNSINLEWLNEEIGVTDLTDPLQNLHSGVFILGDLFEKYGDWNKVLVCYNYGETGAQKHVFSKGLTSTEYSRKVMSLQEKWAEVIGK